MKIYHWRNVWCIPVVRKKQYCIRWDLMGNATIKGIAITSEVKSIPNTKTRTKIPERPRCRENRRRSRQKKNHISNCALRMLAWWIMYKPAQVLQFWEKTIACRKLYLGYISTIYNSCPCLLHCGSCCSINFSCVSISRRVFDERDICEPVLVL